MCLANKQLDNFITVGKVIASFGLKGQVKVDVYLADLKLLKSVDIFRVGNALEERKICFLKNTKNSTWIGAIPGTKNKEQADQLKGHLIYIETKYQVVQENWLSKNVKVLVYLAP